MPLPLRAQAERVARRVLDEYRHTGVLPGPFRARLYDTHGAWYSYEDVKDEVRAWAQEFCQQTDQGQTPELAGR